MKTKALAALFFITFLVTPIVFVSVLGENNHTDDLVVNYFNKLKDQNFSDECPPIFSNQIKNQISEKVTQTLSGGATCANDNFALAISLLHKFDLLNTSDYSVKTKRDGFWFPFITKNTMTVSVKLVTPDDNTFMSFFDGTGYLSGLFVVQRKGFRWEIKHISLNHPDLIDSFHYFRDTLNFEKYVKETDVGFELNNAAINKDMGPIDRLLLKFNLQKINDFLEP